MRVVTNPGSNLSLEAIRRIGAELLPQQIVVDGVEHDTRGDIDTHEIDAWVKTARVHPYVVGTTAAQFMTLARQVAQSDRTIVAVMTSRKIIGSYDAATVAAKTLGEASGFADLNIRVCDTGVTDVGAGLACLLAHDAAQKGLRADQIADALEAFRRAAKLVFTVKTLDYMVKGGRATTLRALLANVMGVRPIVGFVDGEPTLVDRMSRDASQAEALATRLEKDLGPRRRVAIAVFHGRAPEEAQRLEHALSRRLDVVASSIRPLSASIYLHAGPGSVGAAVIPLDALPFQPSARALLL